MQEKDTVSVPVRKKKRERKKDKRKNWKDKRELQKEKVRERKRNISFCLAVVYIVIQDTRTGFLIVSVSRKKKFWGGEGGCPLYHYCFH